MSEVPPSLSGNGIEEFEQIERIKQRKSFGQPHFEGAGPRYNSRGRLRGTVGATSVSANDATLGVLAPRHELELDVSLETLELIHDHVHYISGYDRVD